MDQISVLSMAQAVTEKRQNPPAAENSQTQSSFREMLADRRRWIKAERRLSPLKNRKRRITESPR